MTKSRLSFVAAIGFLAAGLVTAPAFAGSLSVVKPAVKTDQSAGLHLVDQGSWHQKKPMKKHYRGGYYGGHDNYYRGHKKKKKYRRAYRNGYEEGYYRGRHDGGYNRGYSRYDNHHYRRGHGHNDHRGFIRTPGFYFRF